MCWQLGFGIASNWNSAGRCAVYVAMLKRATVGPADNIMQSDWQGNGVVRETTIHFSDHAMSAAFAQVCMSPPARRHELLDPRWHMHFTAR